MKPLLNLTPDSRLDFQIRDLLATERLTVEVADPAIHLNRNTPLDFT